MAPTAAPARTRRAPATRRSPAPARTAPVRRPHPRGHGPRRQRSGNRPLVLALSVALSSVLAVAGAHAYLVQGQVRLARLEQQLGSAQTRQRDLEVQVASLDDPSHVVSQAESQGLTVPAQVTDLPLVGSGTPAGATAGR